MMLILHDGLIGFGFDYHTELYDNAPLKTIELENGDMCILNPHIDEAELLINKALLGDDYKYRNLVNNDYVASVLGYIVNDKQIIRIYTYEQHMRTNIYPIKDTVRLALTFDYHRNDYYSTLLNELDTIGEVNTSQHFTFLCGFYNELALVPIKKLLITSLGYFKDNYRFLLGNIDNPEVGKSLSTSIINIEEDRAVLVEQDGETIDLGEYYPDYETVSTIRRDVKEQSQKQVKKRGKKKCTKVS